MRPLPVANPWAGAPVLYRRRTATTMHDALRLYRRGSPGGTVVAAGRQGRGRGRLEGRRWEAQAGRSLLFTIALDSLPPMPPQRLPVLAGLAVAAGVEEQLGLRLQVKWPNDVVHEGRKLAGVLCESVAARRPGRERVYLVGIGVNCNQLGFRGELARTAASLALLRGGSPVERWPLLECILRRLAESLEDPRWRQRLVQRLAGLGQTAALLRCGPTGEADGAGAVVLEGTVEGVADDGALLLRPAGASAPVPVYSGELRLSLSAAPLPGAARSGR